ncbi:hypothetical protein H6503_05905 [Candidatus Woesearchaeota archaeon]|nr:hypothetical protein [Candidatus Woesearchaeota archaeon]
MKKIYSALLFALFLSLFALPFAIAEHCEITFFYSPTCPHCAAEKVLLNDLELDYPELNITRIDVTKDYAFYKEFAENRSTLSIGVPRTFIGDKVFIGFTEEAGDMQYIESYKAYNGYENQIELSILGCLEADGVNVSGSVLHTSSQEDKENIYFIPLMLLLIFGIFYFIFRKKLDKRYMIGGLIIIFIIIFFYLAGHFKATAILDFASQFSFPIFTFIIALLDGFNPCAIAVLAILLSLLVYAQSKSKMFLIGSVFIVTSGVMYFLFIIVLLALRTELLGEYKGIIRISVGLIALVVGLINVKDFFFFKKGISMSIKDKHMHKILARGRQIVKEVKEAKTAKGLTIAIIGTIILAAFVNLVELGCTLILPVQYNEVLITNYGVELTMMHYLYIAFYCLVYVIPLFVILMSFMYTFKSERMSEGMGKILKLVSGIVLIALGLIMLLKPTLLVFG